MSTLGPAEAISTCSSLFFGNAWALSAKASHALAAQMRQLLAQYWADLYMLFGVPFDL